MATDFTPAQALDWVFAEPRTAKLAVVTNARRYGGKFSLCPDAHATQPGLHLVALHSDSALAIFSRSTDSITSNRATASFALLDCSGPMRWSSMPS